MECIASLEFVMIILGHLCVAIFLAAMLIWAPFLPWISTFSFYINPCLCTKIIHQILYVNFVLATHASNVVSMPPTDKRQFCIQSATIGSIKIVLGLQMLNTEKVEVNDEPWSCRLCKARAFPFFSLTIIDFIIFVNFQWPICKAKDETPTIQKKC